MSSLAVEEPSQTCPDCGETITDETAIDEVCAACISDHYVCVGDALYHVDGGEVVYASDVDDYILSAEARDCTDCGDIFHEDSFSHQTADGYTVCTGCIDYAYRHCEDTDRYVRDDDIFYSEIDDCYYEDADNAPEYNRNRHLHQYNANILDVLDRKAFINGRARYLGHPCKTLLLGVELETDRRGYHDASGIAEHIHDMIDRMAICKEDSTCSGPEIVTLPMDMISHYKAFPWQKLCEELKDKAKGYYGRDNGMHVHADRRYLSALELGKLLVFMNDKKNQPFLETVAQRDLSESQWAPLKPDENSRVSKAAKYPRQGKYSIVNVTMTTCEFRMFNSSLLPERIYKNLEFVLAVCNWVKVTSIQDLNKASFLRFITQDAGTYKHLVKFLADRSEA